MVIRHYDYIVLGAGMFGLHAADILSQRGLKVAVLEYDPGAFMRASYINQARVHNGYHYPRSYSTAVKSAHYFERFYHDFDFAVHRSFKKIYAIAKNYSLSSAENFEKFCGYSKIPCEQMPVKHTPMLNEDTIESAFLTQEYTFDAMKIRDYFLQKLQKTGLVDFLFNFRLEKAEPVGRDYHLTTASGDEYHAPSVLNATYAGINAVLDKFHFEKFKIKYEICEIILCDASERIKELGVTVMDGPFFSLMPFGLTGLHSLTSVTFTPHLTSYQSLPTFPCQARNSACIPTSLENCNTCPAKPESAWQYMFQIAKKYMHLNNDISYKSSLFSIKPILLASELDDSRPTVIRTLSTEPTFISVLSGKINTIYDLEGVL